MSATKDMDYLKKFVKQHPDNKMGWYLLGKQYLLVGKEGKANYCFVEAGEVYDAFEHESHPLSAHHLEQLKIWDKQQKKKQLLRRAAALAMLMLLVAVLIPANGSISDKEELLPTAVPPVESANVGVVFVSHKERNPIGSVWNKLMQAGSEAPQLTIAARLEEQSGWSKWSGNTRFIMTVQKQAKSAELQVAMYDRAACECEPLETSKLSAAFRAWSEQQELHWTLASAIIHYERKHGKWPGQLDDLVRPYPNNALAGEKNGMREMFEPVLTKLKKVKVAKSSGRPIQPNEQEPKNLDQDRAASSGIKVGTNGLVEEQWSDPLEIVVDKATHQLAVIQGNIIVRSYKVGLGGEETPEGSFYISEKVRDPNGSANGTFGSRGMTLSNTLYAIHGTDEPDSIGKDESLGCVRMSKADVEELYDLVPLGTVVKIKNGTLPSKSSAPAERFQLQPRQNENNPAKVYKWLN